MLHVSVLGEQTITDGRTGGVRIRSSRTVALLGFLAAHAGSPQPRQRIAGLFWPDSTDAQALTNLRRELHNLRLIMDGEPALVVTARDLCWRDTATCEVDLRVFEGERAAAAAAHAAGDGAAALTHAERAVERYRGEFLPGAYDEWLLEIRSGLERQCADLCDLICRERAQTGHLAGAAHAARRRIALQPLEETGYRALMRLQADMGDRAGALTTYHRCASVLESELGVTPDAATTGLMQRLMARADAGRRLPAADTAVERPRAAPTQLVGRAGELSELTRIWRAAAAGRPSLALVRGGAGVGKTRLVAAVADLARLQGAVVASTQCYGASGRLALAPVADWLRDPAVQSATAALEPAWRAEVDRLVPSGAVKGQPAVSSRALVDAWQRHRFFEGLARALTGAGRPTLLVIDNLHWCDQETLAFITFCLGLDPAAQIMVTGTVRDDSPGTEPELADWIARMRAGGLYSEISLEPLEASDTARLAAALTGRAMAEDEIALLQATTGGFPLYVVEAVRSGTATVADSGQAGDLAAVLRNRFSQVSAAADEIAGLAAAVGTDFSLDLLTEASDLEADVVVDAVDELWRARIMREFKDGYDFSHDLLRESAYGQISPPKRWLLHRRIAQGLELLHVDGTDQVAAQLAEQYARGGRPDRAVSYYQRAADIAAGVFAHAEAIRLHEQALAILKGMLPSRDRDERELAGLEAIASPLNARYGYSSRELERVLERSVGLAESLGRRDAMFTALVALCTSQFVQGRTALSHRTALRAMELAEAGSELSGAAHFVVGGTAMHLGKLEFGLRHLALARKEAGSAVLLSIGSRPGLHAHAWAAHGLWLVGRDADALAASREVISAARSVGHPYSLAIALAYSAITHQLSQADPDALIATVAELRELCDRYGFAYYREWGLVLDGWARGGQVGIDLARQGISNLRSHLAFARMPYWQSLLADLQLGSGRIDAARATLDAALVTGQANDDVWWLPEVLRMRAALDDAASAALDRLRAAAELAASHGSIALQRRCENDIAALEAGSVAGGVRSSG